MQTNILHALLAESLKRDNMLQGWHLVGKLQHNQTELCKQKVAEMCVVVIKITHYNTYYDLFYLLTVHDITPPLLLM